jgi:hypothetical protein
MSITPIFSDRYEITKKLYKNFSVMDVSHHTYSVHGGTASQGGANTPWALPSNHALHKQQVSG